MALLLGKFSILTKQFQTYDSAREIGWLKDIFNIYNILNIYWIYIQYIFKIFNQIFWLKDFLPRILSDKECHYIWSLNTYVMEKRKVRAGFCFFFLTRTILLLTATWFHKSTNISPHKYFTPRVSRCFLRSPSIKICPTLCSVKSTIKAMLEIHWEN